MIENKTGAMCSLQTHNNHNQAEIYVGTRFVSEKNSGTKKSST